MFALWIFCQLIIHLKVILKIKIKTKLICTTSKSIIFINRTMCPLKIRLNNFKKQKTKKYFGEKNTYYSKKK